MFSKKVNIRALYILCMYIKCIYDYVYIYKKGKHLKTEFKEERM